MRAWECQRSCRLREHGYDDHETLDQESIGGLAYSLVDRDLPNDCSLFASHSMDARNYGNLILNVVFEWFGT